MNLVVSGLGMVKNMSGKKNIVLIGMPGSGKSTIGILLAKHLAYDFVDTDVLIQTSEGRTLQEIMDEEGYLRLRQIEALILQKLTLENHVIATGGSAVYDEAAMQNLLGQSICIYLQVSLETLDSRISNYTTRGIARRPDQSFDDLFNERSELYMKYADIVIPGDELNQESCCQAIVSSL
jgi:shikimate kinase